MVPSESTPLLPAHNNGSATPPETRSFRERFVSILKAEDEPTWLESYKWFFFGSWFNILLVFVPLSVIAHNMHWDVALRFGFSFMAIMPLAKVALCVLLFSILLFMLSSSSVTPQNKCLRNLAKLLQVFSTLPLVTQSKSSSASRLYFKVNRRVSLLVLVYVFSPLPDEVRIVQTSVFTCPIYLVAHLIQSRCSAPSSLISCSSWGPHSSQVRLFPPTFNPIVSLVTSGLRTPGKSLPNYSSSSVSPAVLHESSPYLTFTHIS